MSEEIKMEMVTLSALKEMAEEGILKRKRGSKYREVLVAFKSANQPAMKLVGITKSQATQITQMLPDIFGKGKVASRAVNTTPEGKLDLLLIRRTAQTEELVGPVPTFGRKGK